MGEDASPPPKPEPLDVDALTWSALLAQSVRLAQAAVALPTGDAADGRAGDAWRASVPEVIRLQAVWFALQRAEELSPEERALGRDRAAVALDEAGLAIRAAWTGADLPVPEGIASLLIDVHDAIQANG